jgi:hypothetical protein
VLTAQFAGSRRVKFSAAGLADGDLFGLKKRGNLILNLRGVGDAIGVGVGLGGTSVFVFLRMSLGVGEAAGDSAAEGDAPLSTGGVASVLFSVRCFAGEGDSVGVPVSSCDRTCATPIVRPIPNIKPTIRTEDFSAVTTNPFSSPAVQSASRASLPLLVDL